jgi:plasmid stabilization system protein ParE
MVYEVIYTTEFENEFEELIDYLSNKWSIKTAQQFANQLDDLIFALSKMPFIGKKSLENPMVRGIVVTDKNTLFYSVRDNQIILLSLFDTRQNLNPLE